MSEQEFTGQILGVLEPAGLAVGVRPCIPANELRVDDTLFASGFASGDRRQVLGVHHDPATNRLYVRVREGWYRWDRVYVNVLAF